MAPRKADGVARLFRLVLSLMVGAFAPVAGAVAQDVELRSLDGSVALEGNLLAYDGAFYRIETIFGDMTVAAEGVSCVGPGCPDLATFTAVARIAGADSVAQTLLPELITGFAAAQGLMPERSAEGAHVLRRADGSVAARFEIIPGTSADGFRALLNGSADIALSLRAPLPQEIRASREAFPEDPALTDRVRVLALDGLVPIVAPTNATDGLSPDQLAEIFTGRISNWGTVGGPDAPIALHMPARESGLTQDASERILSRASADPSAQITYHDSLNDLAQAVAGDGYAIGLTSRAATGPVRALPVLDACGFAHRARIGDIKAEDYPFTGAVFMFLAPRRLPLLVRQFLDYSATEQAQAQVRAAGYVDQSISRTALSRQGDRLANAIQTARADDPETAELGDLQRMLEALSGAERLSTTLRFTPGGTDLDIHSRAAIARLAAAIDRGRYDGRTLVLAGFSDGLGDANRNAQLSARRAGTVQEAVLAAIETDPTRISFRVEGFGEALPMACDDTDWGRAVNRRVEVWLD